MVQEVKIDLQLHLEVDCTRTKQDIKTILELFISKINNSSKYIDLIALDIHSIQEETEIYGTE